MPRRRDKMEKEKKSTESLDKKTESQDRKKLSVEELEERVAMSVPAQKKMPGQPPYMPGTDYGLVKRSNIKEETPKKEPKKLSVEELEERVAMSVPAQKKTPTTPPYTPGTLYGLAQRSNIKEEKPQKEPQKLTVEELEERVAMSVPAQKKTPTTLPYTPGTRYGLVKRSNL
jgi:uncharacterized small protein (DUF1192 family)